MLSPTRVTSFLPIGPKRPIIFLLAAAVFAGCATGRARTSESQLPATDQAVDHGAREWMQTISEDVTRDGPIAWIKHFERGTAFFMAVNGQLAFPNGQAAEEGIRKFAQTIRRIELKWGKDLRVDTLTANLAVVAVSWREVQVDTAGHRVDEAGYFTGLAEYRKGHWRFRDAHWSAPVSRGQ